MSSRGKKRTTSVEMTVFDSTGAPEKTRPLSGSNPLAPKRDVETWTRRCRGRDDGGGGGLESVLKRENETEKGSRFLVSTPLDKPFPKVDLLSIGPDLLILTKEYTLFTLETPRDGCCSK